MESSGLVDDDQPTPLPRPPPDLYYTLSPDRPGVNEADRCLVYTQSTNRVAERVVRDVHLLNIPYKCSSRSDYSSSDARLTFSSVSSLFFPSNSHRGNFVLRHAWNQKLVKRNACITTVTFLTPLTSPSLPSNRSLLARRIIAADTSPCHVKILK